MLNPSLYTQQPNLTSCSRATISLSIRPLLHGCPLRIALRATVFYTTYFIYTVASLWSVVVHSLVFSFPRWCRYTMIPFRSSSGSLGSISSSTSGASLVNSCFSVRFVGPPGCCWRHLSTTGALLFCRPID